jgi:hypothetical protein
MAECRAGESHPRRRNARFRLLDRDTTFDLAFGRAVEALGLTAVRTAPRDRVPQIVQLPDRLLAPCRQDIYVLHEIQIVQRDKPLEDEEIEPLEFLRFPQADGGYHLLRADIPQSSTCCKDRAALKSRMGRREA